MYILNERFSTFILDIYNVKDIRLEWDDYYDWLDKVRSAKALWLNDGLSDEDFLNIVHELD